MSSPYVVLGDRPLDQWKVTELKEELKKRKLTIRGLKEDLVKRLDEAVRLELEESANESADNGSSNASESELPSDQVVSESVVSESINDPKDIGIGSSDKVDGEPENRVEDQKGSMEEFQVVEADLPQETNIPVLDVEQATKIPGEETTVVVSETIETTTVVVSETIESTTVLSGSDLVKDAADEVGDITAGLQNDISEPYWNDPADPISEPLELNQTSVVSPSGPSVPDSEIQNEAVSSTVHLANDGADEVGDITAGLQNDISEPYWNDPADPISEPLELNQTSVVSPSGPSVPDSEIQNEAVSSTVHLANDVSNVPQPESDIQLLEHQVSKVDSELRFEVSDSISTESVTNIEKNELKVDVFTDNVTLELDVKHEMVQPSLRSITPDGGESHPMDAEEPHDKKDLQEPLDKIVSKEETGGSNRENVASPKNIDNKDLDPPEKLNLELTSGEDPMEEDILPSEQVEYKTNSSEIQVDMEQSGIPVTNEDNDVDVVGVDKPAEIKVANAVMAVPGLQSAKRKMHDNDTVGGNDTTKRSRRWNTEGLKGSEPDSSKAVASAIPMDSSQPTPRRFSRSDSTVNEEAPKERVVPPSSKPPTNSLRIDQFLRPFTLKAVQELLGKTGTITSFWMDHIKTHCYISYSSVEEAVETRNAVYNLQWPPNGGRMLIAEFVDPQEVKTRIDPPPAAPSSSAAPPPPTGQPQPSPRQQLLRQQLPPQPLPPPPPIRERPIPLREAPSREQPLQARDRLNLPPPPPLPEKVEPPIVTLDDLFKKTKSTPRIYYLPLSDEQVAVKLASQKNIN